MRRRELLRHLEKHGCEFLREGGNHTIYVNRRAQKSSAVPRHREIIDFLARKIAKTWIFPSRDIFLNRFEPSRWESSEIDGQAERLSARERTNQPSRGDASKIDGETREAAGYVCGSRRVIAT